LPELTTRKEDLFIAEYLVDTNATRAYLATHPRASEATAAQNGSKLLKKPRVAAALAAETNARLRRLHMSGDEALALISLTARADVTMLYEPDAPTLAARRFLPMAQWPPELKAAVKTIRETKFGSVVELHDLQHARELMAKAAGKLKDIVLVGRTLEDALAEVNALERERAAS
jgi:phage terminase small subunit